VLLLPNNKNVVLTAKHAAELAEGIKVSVIPTLNMPQGISALLAFDPNRGADENAKRLTDSIASVRAVEVTRAVRATSNGGRKIKKGDVLALVDDEISEVGGDETDVINRVLEKAEPKPELVTVFRGASTSEDAAEAMVATLKAANPETEFELHDGGQEHYPYVLALE
jgi:dihydroxyacetone kinase-like predicted kinase